MLSLVLMVGGGFFTTAANAGLNLTSSVPGLWSTIRESLVGNPCPPVETGDLAYRGTFSREQLLALQDPRITTLCDRRCVTLWIGPEKHVVFYPVRASTQFNMVLLRPDDLPQGTRTSQGDIEEMRSTFHGWDEM
jgi:salicylate hydroxylase